MRKQWQPGEIREWLGDAKDTVTDEQFKHLLDTANKLEDDYPSDPEPPPGEGFNPEHDAALDAEFQVMSGDDPMEHYAYELARVRREEKTAMAGLRQAARLLVPGKYSEVQFAKDAGINRLTVRKMLGKD